MLEYEEHYITWKQTSCYWENVRKSRNKAEKTDSECQANKIQSVPVHNVYDIQLYLFYQTG